MAVIYSYTCVPERSSCVSNAGICEVGLGLLKYGKNHNHWQLIINIEDYLTGF